MCVSREEHSGGSCSRGTSTYKVPRGDQGWQKNMAIAEKTSESHVCSVQKGAKGFWPSSPYFFFVFNQLNTLNIWFYIAISFPLRPKRRTLYLLIFILYSFILIFVNFLPNLIHNKKISIITAWFLQIIRLPENLTNLLPCLHPQYRWNFCRLRTCSN